MNMLRSAVGNAFATKGKSSNDTDAARGHVGKAAAIWSKADKQSSSSSSSQNSKPSDDLADYEVDQEDIDRQAELEQQRMDELVSFFRGIF
jgi:hypothetical protein